jgi:hypothetical protein
VRRSTTTSRTPNAAATAAAIANGQDHHPHVGAWNTAPRATAMKAADTAAPRRSRVGAFGSPEARVRRGAARTSASTTTASSNQKIHRQVRWSVSRPPTRGPMPKAAA